MSDLPARLSLREVGPRDGLQNEDPVPTAGKVALIDTLSRTGVQRIEAVSFVHPPAIPQMADAAEVWAAVERNPGVRYSALVPNLRGAQRALDAGFREIEVVVSASRHPQPQEREADHRAEPGRHQRAAAGRARRRRDLPGDRLHRLGLPLRG